MKHYCTQLIKSQIFHCRIFIEYLRNCYLKAQCPLQILPPAHVFDIRCSVGSHPTNCHRIWDAFWCTWTLKTDWISDLYQSWLCVWAQYKFCIISCALLCGSVQRVSPAHAHCTALYILHILHTRCPLLSHHYTPSGVAHNIIVPCCTGQGVLRCCTSHKNLLQILQNWTLLYKFRVQRLHYALVSSPSTH